MRGALANLAGVNSIDIQIGRRDFGVVYDPKQTGPAALATALEDAGEAVTPAP